MALLREWIRRLWGTLSGRRSDQDLADELKSHLELAAEEARHSGHSAEQAMRSAQLDAGGMAQALNNLRDQRGLPWLDALSRDARYALRALGRSPSFTGIALLTLAIGIGANTAVFSVVNRVLLQPLPYPQAEQLVAVSHAAPGARALAMVSGDLRLSASMYVTYSEQNRTLSAIGVWTTNPVTVTGVAEPEQVRGVLVSDGTLQALGVVPEAGRWLTTSDQQPGAPDVVVLGYGYWQRRFGGQRSVIGQRIRIESRPREIVGVMPEGFAIVTADPDVILPIAFVRSRLILAGFGYQAVARLKPGVTIAEASADLGRMVPIWMRSWPTISGANPSVYESWRISPTLRPLKQDVLGNVQSVLWVVMATIGIVMLIACANVANLLLVRVEGRRHELAVRVALGASAGRIVAALLLESLWLGVLGGALGVGLAYGALHLLTAMAPSSLPRVAEIALDWRALAFATAISLLSGVGFGLIPILAYRNPQIAGTLSGAGRTASASRERHRARSALVVTQVSLALVLLLSSGLMIRSVQALHAVEPGFTEPAQIQTMRISIPPTSVPDAARVLGIQHDIVNKLLLIPGVQAAAFTNLMPVEGFPGNRGEWDALSVENQPGPAGEIPPMRVFKFVSPDFFRASGTRLIAGRDYTWTDVLARRNYAIVSENLARELWRTPAAALGRRIRTIDTVAWREVIGVVQDVHDFSVQEPAPTVVYWPAMMESLYTAGRTNVERTVTFAIRTSGAGTEGLLNQLRAAVWSVDRDLPLASVRTMQEINDQSLARASFALVMLAVAGAMALVLGIVGIYGVISYAVSQRRREIGIRLALGARPLELQRLFVQQGLKMTGIGVAIGLAAAMALSRLMSSLLFGVGALDPITFASVPIVLIAATILASYLPARRAAAVDPVDALKTD